MSSWKLVNLSGAAGIDRVCGVYEIAEHARIPGGRFKIKVLESVEGDYIAVTNVCLKAPDGTPDGRAGLGHSEVEALDKRADLGPADFYWTSPETF